MKLVITVDTRLMIRTCHIRLMKLLFSDCQHNMYGLVNQSNWTSLLLSTNQPAHVNATDTNSTEVQYND
jgi:hypothetical protein